MIFKCRLLYVVVLFALQGSVQGFAPGAGWYAKSRRHGSFAPTHASVALGAVAEVSPDTVTSFDFLGKHRTHAELYKPVGNKKKKSCDVILIHGFGCSTVYWRETVSTLQKAGYTVHALDLLGQGKSSKPGRADDIEYSINLWANQVDDYARVNLPKTKKVVLLGNSLGSVVAMAAATGDYLPQEQQDSGYLRKKCAGIGMYNCGVGMNSRNVLLELDGWQRFIFTALFDVLDLVIFGNLPLLNYILNQVVSKELLANVLTGLYAYAEDVEERIDAVLVDSFYNPAQEDGSPEALSQIYTNDPGKTPMLLYKQYYETVFAENVPIHCVWGTADGVTPISGSVGTFFQGLANTTDKVSMDTVTAGHVPFDEVPACNELMLAWLDDKQQDSSNNNLVPPFKFPFF